MSKIKTNSELDQYGAEPFEQHQFGTAGVEGVITLWLWCQNYLREQPDNLKSFNIIAETSQFVNLVYSNITPQNIDLASQLFETLNEFTVVSVLLVKIGLRNTEGSFYVFIKF